MSVHLGPPKLGPVFHALPNPARANPVLPCRTGTYRALPGREHPILLGTVLGVGLSMVAAAAGGWLVAYRVFGPRYPRRHRAA